MTLGRVLRLNLRRIDSAFRYGRDEMAVILPHCESAALKGLCERLRESFATEADEGRTLSMGAALYQRGMPMESFIRCVDGALFEAKDRGGNAIVLKHVS